MKIGFDLRCLPTDGSPGSGVPYAARALWSAFVQHGRHSLVGFAGRGAMVNDGIPSMVWLPESSGATLRRALAHHPVDCLVVTSGAVARGCSIPMFPWVHDVAIFEHPEWFPQSWFKRQLTTRLFVNGLKKAKHIFCVSESTRQAIHRLFHIPLDCMMVTYEGVSQSREMDEVTKGSFALILGTVEPRKNIDFIISLWPDVCARIGHQVELIVAGKEGWGNVRIKSTSTIKREEHVSHERFEQLIKSARMILTPSLYEGFGRTPLEGMVMGTPVIVSDRGALPEVIGDGGIIIPLEDREKWITMIVKLFRDETFAHEMIKRGHKRAQQFSWQKVVDKMMTQIEKTSH